MGQKDVINLCYVLLGIIHALLSVLECILHLSHQPMHIVILSISKYSSSDSDLYFPTSMISGFLWQCLYAFLFCRIKKPIYCVQKSFKFKGKKYCHLLYLHLYTPFMNIWVCLMCATISWLYLYTVKYLNIDFFSSVLFITSPKLWPT